ncbi:small, acid-soluble spore protein, alpha/beta type [Domibacillus epiphyticus]
MSNSRGSRNQLIVPGAERVLEQFKFEIAEEFGVTLGADTTARGNGSTGGEITKRLIRMAQQELRDR